MKLTQPLFHEKETLVKTLTTPLAKHWGLHFFCYSAYYPDSQGYLIVSNYNDYFDELFEGQPTIFGFNIKSGWKLWESQLPADRLLLNHKHGLGNGIFYANQEKSKIELFSFGTYLDNNRIYDFYLNNQRLLSQFIRYFKESMNDIININPNLLYEAPLNMVQLDPANDDLAIDTQNSTIVNFFNKLTYPFNKLSQRELECYKLLIMGFPIAEIGRKLGLSPGTVDVYISRIKNKLNCVDKIELIQKGIEYKFIEYNLDLLHFK